jgi:hypothetical protein
MMPTIKFNIERWKWSEEYRIYVSTEGRLRRADGTDIKPKVDKKGYLIYHEKKVHRIVMKTWRPCENMDNLTVDHLDHNKRKNSLSNLEWVSAEENQRRASEDYYCPKGEKKIKKYYVEGVEFSRAQMEILFTELVFKKFEHRHKINYCGKDMEVRYEYI